MDYSRHWIFEDIAKGREEAYWRPMSASTTSRFSGHSRTWASIVKP